MKVMKRRQGEIIQIGEVEVFVLKTSSSSVKLGVIAPKNQIISSLVEEIEKEDALRFVSEAKLKKDRF